MDKFDSLVKELVDKTRNDQMEWTIADPEDVSRFVFNAGFTATVFRSSIVKNHKKFDVFFVEKHIPDTDSDYEGIAHKYYPEVYFLRNNKVAFVLDKRYVEIGDLLELVALILEKNEDAKDLFEE